MGILDMSHAATSILNTRQGDLTCVERIAFVCIIIMLLHFELVTSTSCTLYAK